MKFTLVTPLVILYLVMVMAAGYPADPPCPDDVDKPQDTQLTKEEVAAFLKSIIGGGKSEVVKYVASLIQDSNDNGPHTCMLHPVNQSDHSLEFDDSKLTKFLNTIHPVNRSKLPTWNLVTTDHFTTVHANELDPNALYNLLKSPLPNVIWTNYAPCPVCVQTLIEKYEKQEDKPTIYIGRLVKSQDQDTKQVVRVLQCMARLIHKRFKIKAWNINEFKQPLGAAIFTNACNTTIDNFTTNENFDSALSDLSSLVNFIEELEANTHVHTWCST